MLAGLLFNAFCRFRRILCDFISDMCVHCSVASVCSGQSISVLFAFFSSKSAGCCVSLELLFLQQYDYYGNVSRFSPGEQRQCHTHTAAHSPTHWHIHTHTRRRHENKNGNERTKIPQL